MFGVALGATNANLTVDPTLKAAFGDPKPRAVKVTVDPSAEQLCLAATIPETDSLELDFKAVTSVLEEGVPCLVLIRLSPGFANASEADCALLAWTPSDSPVKLRMLCASSRATIRNEFSEFSFKEYTASEKDEVSLEQFIESTRARTEEDRHAAMTQEELDSEEVLRQVAQERASAPKMLAGLAALQVAVLPAFTSAIETLLSAQGDVAVLAELQGESVTAEVLTGISTTSSLKGRLPSRPSYVILRAPNEEAKPTPSFIFLSWLPDNAEVKARMKCSTFKASVVDRVRELVGSNSSISLAEVNDEDELVDGLGTNGSSMIVDESSASPAKAPPRGYGGIKPPAGAFALPGMGPGGLAVQLKKRPASEESTSSTTQKADQVPPVTPSKEKEASPMSVSSKEEASSSSAAAVPPAVVLADPIPTPAAAPAPVSEQSSDLQVFTLAELQDQQIWLAKGVISTERERYLDDATFLKLFGVNKEEFAKLPKWKRDQQKKTHGLF